MINYKGQLFAHWSDLPIQHLSFSQLSDQFSIPIYLSHSKVILLEATYFHIMSALRRWRMAIPMSLTPELIDQQAAILNSALGDNPNCMYQLSLFREVRISSSAPHSELGWVLTQLDTFKSDQSQDNYEVSLYRDQFISADGLSNLPATNSHLRDIALVYAYENGFSDCFLLNTDKQLVETVFGTVFLQFNGEIHTPDLTSGCRHAVIRSAFIEWLQKEKELKVCEKPIVPFELQKADAIGILNPYKGMSSVTKYRKKTFDNKSMPMLFSDFWSGQS